MILIFFGNNEFSIKNSIKEITESSDKEVLYIDSEKINLLEFQNTIYTIPLINEGRVIVVKNLIRNIFNSKEYLSWIKMIKGSVEVPGNHKILFSEFFQDDKELDNFKKSKFFIELKSIATLQDSYIPKGRGSRREMINWINVRSRELGMEMDPRYSSRIENMMERDFFRLDQELTKLALYVKGRQVNEEDIEKVISSSRNEVIFNALDLIINGEYIKSILMIRKLYDEGMNPGELVFLLISSLHRILQIRSLNDEGIKNVLEISSRIGLANNFYLKKLTQQASQKTVDNLFILLEELFYLDKQIKTSNINDKEAIELLLVKLSSKNILE